MLDIFVRMCMCALSMFLASIILNFEFNERFNFIKLKLNKKSEGNEMKRPKYDREKRNQGNIKTNNYAFSIYFV